jgi:DNA-binding MarR family transcriptional regulator
LNGDRPSQTGDEPPSLPQDAQVDAAIAALRSLLLAGQLFRQRAADRLGVWIMDSFALSYLAGSGPITSGELAKGLGLPASSVTSLVDRLEASDFATRRARANDRRVVEVSITEHGKQGVESTAQAARDAMLDLGLGELPAATRIFAGMAHALGERSAALVDPASRERP